jgi:pilus assembly protein CpaC
MKIRNSAKWYVMTAFLMLLFGLYFPALCFAQGPDRVIVKSTTPQKVSLTVGKSVILQSKDSIKRISVASPDVADAHVLTPWQIYLAGKSSGVTNLTLWGPTGSTVSGVFDIEVLPDVTQLKAKIHEMFPQEQDVKVTAAADSLVLSGTVSSAANQSQIVTLAQSYAPKGKDGVKINNFLEVAGVQQVMLEVRVSEMSRSNMKKLGFNWNYISSSGQNFGISVLDNLTRTNFSGTGLDTTVTDPINMIFRFLGDGATWTVFIDALKENGLTKVLAEPTLITLSGKTADFLAGGEFPIPVPDEDGITIDYKSYGVGLQFTPTVLGNGKISMHVAPEVSQLDFTNAIAITGYVVPGLTTRRVSTTIELGDGQSFAVAGLLQDDVREIVRKFPVLGDIPVLGALFRSSNFQKNETELVIIVTPHLVRPLDVKKQTLPTDQYIEPDDFEWYLLGRLEGRGNSSVQGGQSGAATHPIPGPASLHNKGGGLEGDFGHIVQ